MIRVLLLVKLVRGEIDCESAAADGWLCCAVFPRLENLSFGENRQGYLLPSIISFRIPARMDIVGGVSCGGVCFSGRVTLLCAWPCHICERSQSIELGLVHCR